MARTSAPRYLEVLTARPEVGVGLEVTVWDGASPGTMLAQLQGASDVKFQHALADVGSGSFTIADTDPKATPGVIREGNIAKVRLGGIDVFAWAMESTRHVIAEGGDSRWEVSGQGLLSVLSQAVVYPPGWPTPTGSDRSWPSSTAGTVLGTLFAEAQARGALAHLTADFLAATDSHGAPWPPGLSLTIRAGSSLLDVARQLIALGYTVRVTTSLVLQMFAPGTFGRDLSQSVVWRRGRHIAGDLADLDSLGKASTRRGGSAIAPSRHLERVGLRSQLQNAELVMGSGNAFVEVNDPASIADPYTGRREGALSFTQSADPTTMQTAGLAQIEFTQAESNAITVPLTHGAAAGMFQPYADYQPGDWVSLDSPPDVTMERLQVVALTVAQTDAGDYTVDADLNAVALDYLARLRNLISAASGTSSGASGGVASSALGLGAPSASAPSVYSGMTITGTKEPGSVLVVTGPNTAQWAIGGRAAVYWPLLALTNQIS